MTFFEPHELCIAFGSTRLGTRDEEETIYNAMMQIAQGYEPGQTIMSICLKLNLYYSEKLYYYWTKRGKEFVEYYIKERRK